MSLLNQLQAITSKSKKRVGRGYGSGKGGHNSGRGTKGQLSRPGGKRPIWFEGGQLPLIKRLPMWRGKGRLKPTSRVDEITLSDLNRVTKSVVTIESLKLDQLISKSAKQVKVIASGELKQKLTLKGINTTPAAKKAIEAAGGRVS